jgi:hypothetical protein
MTIRSASTVGTLRTSGAASKEAKAAGPTKSSLVRVGAARGGARDINESLVDYGPRTRLMMDLTAAIAGTGRPWQELRADVRAQLPSEPGTLQLSFKKAFEQADASAGEPGSARHISALKQIKTAIMMACILQMA